MSSLMDPNLLALILFANKPSAYYMSSLGSMDMLLHDQVGDMYIPNMIMNLGTSLSTLSITDAAPAIYSVIEFQYPFILCQGHCIEYFAQLYSFILSIFLLRELGYNMLDQLVE